MARATQERLAKDAERFGLKTPSAAEPPLTPYLREAEKKYDANQCPMCRILIGLHSFRDLQDCMRVAAERKAVQP